MQVGRRCHITGFEVAQLSQFPDIFQNLEKYFIDFQLCLKDFKN